MASTVLPNGIIIPEKYSRDWYADLYHNWQELDNLLGGGTPKDGTLTIQKNGSTVGTFSANQATNETINITVPTVNDATLTIQKNGTTVDTFTANSSTDKTVDITVPTKTSDLTNDSGFITSDNTKIPLAGSNAISGSLIPSTDNSIDIGSSAKNIKALYTKDITIDGTQFVPSDYATLSGLATVATSGSYNDLSNKPTIPSKTSELTNDSGFITEDNTKIPLAGSDAISGSLIPSTDGTVNLGGSSYQWNNAYIKSLTINGVACGDILTHNVSEFVDVTTAQIIGGQKIFTHGQTGIGRDLYHFASNPYAKNTPPADTSFQYIWFIGNTASQGLTNKWYGGYLEQLINTDGSARGRWLIRNTNENGMGIQLSQNADGSSSTIIPIFSNIDLGTSTNKWKSINGINPGALSLPGTYINVDTTNWVLDGSNVNIFTPASDGWLGIQATDTVYDQMHYVFIGRNDNASYHSQNVLSPINALWLGSYHGCVFIPVIKNVRYDIRCICSSIIATFYPCQGNV